MGFLIIPANPTFNVSNVPEVLETDPVIYSFINGYWQLLLSNDQALKNMIDKKPSQTDLPKVAKSGSYNDLADLPKVADDDDTVDGGALASARIVKVHGDEIDSIVAFLNGNVTEDQINKILNS